LNCGSLADWNTLFAVQAAAAATLIGLVFVAVSINLTRIIGVPGLPGRAGESVLQFFQVFLISTVALIPKQPVQFVAIEFLSIGVFSWALQAAGQIRYLRLMLKIGHPWSWLLYRALLAQFATVPFCVAGIRLQLGFCDGLYWVVAGFVFSFAAAIFSAWVLLVEILR
jgi:hypothetical protein